MQIEHSLFYVGVGNIIAALLSWKRNKDIIWGVIAFLLGWCYVVYWLLSED